MSYIDIELLRNWFLETKRDFPWRKSLDPYRVFISEVMLQQTQASRVLLYFEKWMELFPTIFALAQAQEKDVIKAWEGLGYYSRARALHKASKTIVENHQGKIPDTKEELLKIQGIGEYTSSAILSFGFHQKKAPVDANVMRLFCRYFQISEDATKQKTKELVQKLAFAELPNKKPWEIAESFIELGATVCKPKNPNCLICPLQEGCKSYSQLTQNDYPKSSKKTIYEKLVRSVCIIIFENSVLVQKVAKDKPCSGLYEFFYFNDKLSPEDAQKKLLDEFGIQTTYSNSFASVDQSFTRFRVKLYPHLFFALENSCIEHHEWHLMESIKSLPFSSGHKKILNMLSW